MKRVANSTEFEYPIPVRAAVRRKPNGGTAAIGIASYSVAKRGRLWELRDASGELVCVTAYKKGAMEVVRRLSTASSSDSALPP